MAEEIEALQTKLIEVSNEGDYRVKFADAKLTSSEEQHQLLNDHIFKLQ